MYVMTLLRALPLGLGVLFVACGSSTPTFQADGSVPVFRPNGDAGATGSGPGTGGQDSGTPGMDSGMMESSDAGVGSPVTCSGTAAYKVNGGACGSERWTVKTGTDTQAPSLSLTPTLTTIATLDALPAAGAGNSRESPTETTLYELRDVTLTELKSESDSDYHLVISDGSKTMIAEIPYPKCATGSPWECFIEHARAEVDAAYTPSSSPQHPGRVISLRGYGFFDVLHGQTGVAPNAIELHPVLQICFGQGCTPS
jgi:hypothetical protein